MKSAERAVKSLALGLAGAPCMAAPIEWSIGEGGNGHLYEVISAPDGISWIQSRDLALALGGDLATITSAAENAFVFERLAFELSLWSSDYGPWLGGFQKPGSAEPDDGWSWVTGESWEFEAWFAGEPSNTDGDEGFLHFIAPDGTGTPSPFWNDFPVSGFGGEAIVTSYIVEYVPAPGAGAMLLGIALLGRRRER